MRTRSMLLRSKTDRGPLGGKKKFLRRVWKEEGNGLMTGRQTSSRLEERKGTRRQRGGSIITLRSSEKGGEGKGEGEFASLTDRGWGGETM